VRCVEGDQALLQEDLRALVVRPRDLEPALVDFLLGLDPVELDLRGVVSLDDFFQARVDRLDLRQNVTSLRLLRGDRRGARGGGEEGRREKGEESYKGCLSLRRSDQNPPSGTMAGADWKGSAVTRSTLTALADGAQTSPSWPCAAFAGRTTALPRLAGEGPSPHPETPVRVLGSCERVAHRVRLASRSPGSLL
jgi:hypothetical protein